MPLDGYLWLPCWGCTKPQASDVRVWLANCSDDDRANQRSPSGLPLCCCRVRTVGLSLTDTMHARRDVSAGGCTHKRGIGRMSALWANRTCRDGGDDVTHSGGAGRIRISGFMECRAGDYSALMPANLTTLRHLSVSSAMNFPKSVGEPVNTAAPRSVRRFFMLESTRAALISLLSFSTISVGVALGTTIPY